MRNLILIIVVLLFSSIAYSQANQDVVYLKNGSIIKGTITEQVPNEQLKIKTIEGLFYTCKFSEIEKIAQEANEVNLDEYGGKLSYGIALGGVDCLEFPSGFTHRLNSPLNLGHITDPCLD